MKKIRLLVVLTFVLIANFATAQNLSVKGVVTDETGVPLIGVVVALDGSSNAVATDVDGMYSLRNVPSNGKLTFSYAGMQTATEEVNGRTEISVQMDQIAEVLDEVVVVGYGTQKKENLTGAVSQVKMEEVLGDRPVTSVQSALQGSIPGLSISGTQKPGESLDINIRGIESINGGSPLILVDGVESQIDLVNPEDIESVSVLKDAASSAIYGARAAFGVVLITTKKANKNTALTINYNTNLAFSKVTNRPSTASVRDILSTHLDYDNDGKFFFESQDLATWIEYVDIFNAGGEAALMEAYPGSYFEASNGAFIPAGQSTYYWLQNNDPTGEIFDDYGFQQIHNVSASGGSERITYRMSMGYTNNDGPLITDKDSYERINVQSNVTGEITDWLEVQLNLGYARSDRDVIDATDARVYATDLFAFEPIYDYATSVDPYGEKYHANTAANQLRYNDPAHTRNENPRVQARATVNPLEGLDFVFDYAYDQNNYNYKYYTNNWEVMNVQQGVETRVAEPTYYLYNTTTRYNSLNIYGTYEKSTNDKMHNFKIMAGFAQENTYFEGAYVNTIDMINPDMPSLSGSTGETKATDSFSDYSIRSGYFRFNYNYDNKYLFEANGRYDGSSKFPTDSRFGFFPSVSAGWQVARESFMDWSSSWLNQFKIRASWGEIGNQAISNYAYIPSMSSSYASWIVDGAKPVTLGLPSMVSDSFTWEKVRSFDIGFDLNMFNNRFTSSFSWYRRETLGMLAAGMQYPSVVGTDAALQNTADLEAKGWELSIGWQDKIGEDWRYGINLNIYDSRSFITSYHNESGLLSDYYEGYEFGEIWGYKADRYYTIDDFVSSSDGVSGWEDDVWTLKDGVTSVYGNNNIRPGDVKFLNLRDDDNTTNQISSGDGTVENPGDREIIGNSEFRYQFGANFTLGWKQFDLSLMFDGCLKRDVWISTAVLFPMGYSGYFSTVYDHQLDYWKPVDAENGNWEAVNPDAAFPRLYDQASASGSNNRVSDKYLQNGAYVRLKNITISYTIPQSVLSKVNLKNAKVFFSGENLFTIDDLPDGIDAAAGSTTFGYPNYAIYSFGLSLTL